MTPNTSASVIAGVIRRHCAWSISSAAITLPYSNAPIAITPQMIKKIAARPSLANLKLRPDDALTSAA
jgi:hypothetical protein